MLKTILLVLVLDCTTAGLAMADCINLTGKFFINGEDGGGFLRIKQAGCKSVSFYRETNYLETVSKASLTLIADGIFRRVYGGLLGGKEAYMMAGRFVGQTFEVTEIPAFSSANKNPLSSFTVYSLDSKKNLVIADKSYDGKGNLSYQAVSVFPLGE